MTLLLLYKFVQMLFVKTIYNSSKQTQCTVDLNFFLKPTNMIFHQLSSLIIQK